MATNGKPQLSNSPEEQVNHPQLLPELVSHLRNNRAGFQRYTFDPRVLVDVSQRDQSTTVLGERLASPLILAPTGFTRIADPQGELATTARAMGVELGS